MQFVFIELCFREEETTCFYLNYLIFVKSVIRDRCSQQLLSHKPESFDSCKFTIIILESIFHTLWVACVGTSNQKQEKNICLGIIKSMTTFCRNDFISFQQKHVKRVLSMLLTGQLKKNLITILYFSFYSLAFYF